MRIFLVARNEGLESFLTSSVPGLQPDHFALHCDVFGDEIDADGGLVKMKITFLVGSN